MHVSPFEVHLPLLVRVKLEQLFSEFIDAEKLHSVGLSSFHQILLDVFEQIDNKVVQHLEHFKGELEDEGGIDLC